MYKPSVHDKITEFHNLARPDQEDAVLECLRAYSCTLDAFCDAMEELQAAALEVILP